MSACLCVCACAHVLAHTHMHKLSPKWCAHARARTCMLLVQELCVHTLSSSHKTHACVRACVRSPCRSYFKHVRVCKYMRTPTHTHTHTLHSLVQMNFLLTPKEGSVLMVLLVPLHYCKDNWVRISCKKYVPKQECAMTVTIYFEILVTVGVKTCMEEGYIIFLWTDQYTLL